MHIFDFMEAIFWQFSKKLKNFFSRFPVSFYDAFFGLYYIWRPN